MVYALTRYEKKQIAKLNTEDLSHSVTLMVNGWKDKARKAFALSRKAETPEAKRTALAKLDEFNRKLEDYIAEQRAMFEKKGLSKERMWREAMIPTGETNANGVEVIRIVKREEPLMPLDWAEEEVLKADDEAMGDAPGTVGDGDDDYDAALSSELIAENF